MPRPAKCAHHWLLADKVVPLSRAKAAQFPNCWGRPATCKLCRRATILPEQVWEEQSARAVRRSGRPPRQASDVVRSLDTVRDVSDPEDFVTPPEPDLADLEHIL